MCDEYLTGPALHRAIAEAMEAGEGPEVFEHFSNVQKCWVTASNWTYLVGSDSDGNKIRQKPRMRHLTDMHGQRWEWPEPMQHRPRHSGPYYVPFINNGAADSLKAEWTNHPVDIQRFNRGFCFETDGAAEQHARALIAASGGKAE